MEALLLKLKLKKAPLIFLDSDGKPIVFTKLEPRWKTILKNPIKNYRKYKQKLILKHSYGPPYQPNMELAKEFLEESMTSKVSLMSIHDCLSSKIDPNIMNKANANNRAIHYAARRGNVNFGRMLLRARADVNCRNSLGMTPLMVASAGKFSMHTNFVRFMIDNGAKVDDKDRAGSTALVHAVMNINVNNVAVLLHHNATVVEPVHEMMSLEVPEALTIGKFLRARDENVNSEPGMSDEYFALMKISGPSIIDRVCSLGICRPSNIVVDMLEMAHEKKFLNYYEISKENYANLFWHLLHHLHLKRIKTTKEVVQKKRKVLQIQKVS